MKRGDIVIVRQKGEFTSKPRSAVIVQASALIENAPALVVCLITGDLVVDPPFFRIPMGPTSEDGLTKKSQIMADLPIPIRQSNVSHLIVSLDDATTAKLNLALALYLELG